MRVKGHWHLWFAISGIAASIFATPASPRRPSDSQEKASDEAISDYRRLCHRDGGRLWGRSLCGPVILVDPATRVIYTDRDAARHDLRAVGALFTGSLPSNVGIANTSIDWAGTRWTMVMLPLPSDSKRRDTLLMHEAFHRIQPDRLPPPMAALPDHLDTFDGRLLLRLEWRALAQALRTDDDQQRTAISDALAFRAFRRSLATDAAERENALEINEGLAEYTGKRLGAGRGAVSSALAALADYDRRNGYVRSFAYASGPAYGLLLDRLSPRWRDGLRPDSDLGELMHHAIGDIPLPEVPSIRDGYGFAGIRSEEEARADAHAVQAAHWRAALVDAPVMRLPLIDMEIEFNPQSLFSLAPSGTVYPTAVIRDVWGTLTVRQGVLIAQDGKSASVGGPVVAKGGEYAGVGWTLRLSPEWMVSNGSIRHR